MYSPSPLPFSKLGMFLGTKRLPMTSWRLLDLADEGRGVLMRKKMTSLQTQNTPGSLSVAHWPQR